MFWQSLDNLLTRIRPYRQPLSLVSDAGVVAVCWQITYLFRLGFERWLSARPAYDALVMGGLVAVYAAVFLATGIPRGMWRFSGFGEVQRLTVACIVAGLLGAVTVLMLQLNQVPRAVLALHPVFSLIGLCMVRIGYRMLYEHIRGRLTGSTAGTRRALILGAGNAARLLVAGLQHQGWVIVGLLDDNPVKRNARVGGLPVLGKLDQVKPFAVLHGITHLVIAMPSVRGSARKRVFDLAAQTRLPILTVPTAQELRGGRAADSVRDIQPEDLLGREPVALDEAAIADCINSKTVLVTGAGGSIGSELCRQIARYGPHRIILFELSELALYTIEQELSERFPHVPLVRLIGDVRESNHLRETFALWRPQIVFHAAAYKHVPLMEHENAWAALRNNTLGTYYTARAAGESGVERFVLISTDKAVNPTNVMGATKRAAEMAISALAGQYRSTRFMAVRFGNVLGSSGSVIPKFKEQIARGGPVTVTHPDIIRYFMTIPEATQLVLQAAAIGESGQVMVLDMGEPVKILDLARELIRLSGHSANEVSIEFSGLRPGEKLYEELLADEDATLPTRFERLRIARLKESGQGLDALIRWAEQASPSCRDAEVRAQLASLVPEYQSPGT